MSLHAKKYYPRRLQRRWEDAVSLVLAIFVALVVAVLFSVTSAHAADVTWINSLTVVTETGSVPTQPTALVVSRDGRHAYVANRLDNTLVCFDIDAAGNWQNNAVYAAPATSGVVAPVQLSISHDGTRLYVLGDPAGNADTLTEFAVNTTTGALTFKKLHTNGSGSVIGLIDPAGIAVSPDDAQVYVTSHSDHRVLVFARQADGDLAFAGSLQDGTDGVDGLNGADQIAISADGKSVYVSSSVDSRIATFARDTATGAPTFVNMLIDGTGGVDGLSGAHAIVVSADGMYVYAAGLNEDAIAVLQRNTTTGVLAPYKIYRNGDVSGVATIRGLNGITALRLAPHRNQLYAVSALDSALVIFQRDPATGDLALQDVLSDGIDNIDGLLQPLDLVVDAQNHYLYSISTEQKIGQFAVSNAAPVAVGDDAVAIAGVTSVINVLMNDTDTDAGDTLRVVGVTPTASTHGVIELVDGRVLYTPADDSAINSDSFTYTIADARGAEAVATVMVSINSPPVAMNDTATTNVNVPVTIYVLANDYDPDGTFRNTMSIAQFESISQQQGSVNPENIPRSLRLVASPKITALTYTPPADFSGVDTFTYSVSDDHGGTATGTVTVIVGDGVGIATQPPPAANSARKKSGGGASDFVSLALMTITLLAGLRLRRNRRI